MRITLIRHLPTEWNKKTWLQGRIDIGISTFTEDVTKSLSKNHEILNQLSPFECVLASSLKRTHQTAHHYGYKCETEALLDELDFGEFEGRPKKELLETYGEIWTENPRKLILGESLIHFEERIIRFLEKYKDFSNILAFGHGSWIRGLMSISNFGDIRSMNQLNVENNACVTFTFSPGEG